MELDASGVGFGQEAGAAGVAAEQSRPQTEAGEQAPGQIVVKESFCMPWVEDPAGFDPAQTGWESAAGNLTGKIKEMLAAAEVVLTADGLTPVQAAAKEQAELTAAADARAAKLAKDLAAARTDVEQAVAELPPGPAPVEVPPAPAGTEIGQLVEAPVATPTPAAPMTAETDVSSPAQLLEQLPAEMRQEIEQRLSEFGEDFDEDKFSQEHPEEYALINQVISESSDPAKAAEAAGKVKARLDILDKQEDGDKKKKDFLVNLFGIYKRRFDQEADPEKKAELKKSMAGLNKELAGLGVGSLAGILEVIIGAVVGEVQEQLK